MEFSFSPTSIDTSAAPQTITVTARITDDLAGFYDGAVYFYSPSLGQSAHAGFGPSNRVSGTDLDGTYKDSMTVRKFSEQGTWAVRNANWVDNASNRAELSTADLVAMGFPTTFYNGP